MNKDTNQNIWHDTNPGTLDSYLAQAVILQWETLYRFRDKTVIVVFLKDRLKFPFQGKTENIENANEKPGTGAK